MGLFFLLSCIVWVSLSVISLIFAAASFREKEGRAVFISLTGFAASIFILYFIISIRESAVVRDFNIFVVTATVFFIVTVLIKIRKTGPEINGSEITQYDERDHMFARNNLKYYPRLAQTYYKTRPEKKKIDEKIWKLPEPGDKGGRFYDSQYSPLANSYSEVTQRLFAPKEFRDELKKEKVKPEQLSSLIKEICLYLGATDVGICELKPFHFYSHSGRQADDWGNPIDSAHKYAIAIIVAMDMNMIRYAPAAPVVVESTRQYLEAAKIATVLENYIQRLGYSACAHIDAHYKLACVPVAADAGLGEVSRMGLLIHPVYGPCLRISAVTADMPLIASHRITFGVAQFCKICKKCADNCPTGAIEQGNAKVSRGFAHWSIEQEACFTYWKRCGTDCAFCIRVCPFTKPNTFIHRLARWYVARNGINRRIALFMDDLLYGRKPIKPKKNPPTAKFFNY